ncbi:Uma2 family endonuclease [Nocardia nepalensis]|uniref:Uma2 family endonuclease n=1 Tax=Nocardia nepalensis TaxID=3375448 RepID=UPI003B66FCA8
MASLSLMSLGNDKALRWKAWRPIAYVVGLDAIGGIIVLASYNLIHQASSDQASDVTEMTPSAWPMIISGIAAPALLRAQTPRTQASSSWRGLVGGRRLFGPVRKYQQKAEREIEDICTGEETTWLRDEIISVIGLSVVEVGDWTEQYLTRTRAFPEKARKRKERIGQIRGIVNDQQSSDDIRKMTIATVLLDQEGHRAVRQLFRYGRQHAPAQIFKRRSRIGRYLHFARTPTKGPEHRLRGDLCLPDGFQIDLLDGRVRVCHPDRTVDDALRDLAGHLRRELGAHAKVEGIYHGWIVIRPAYRRGRKNSLSQAVERFAKHLRECEAIGHVLVQPDGTVLDKEKGLFAVAGLVASPTTAPRDGNGYCGDAFCGTGIWLAADVGYDSDIDDGRAYKKHFHATANVPLYLLLDMQKRQVTLHANPSDGTYQHTETVEFGQIIQLPAPLNIKLHTSIFET